MRERGVTSEELLRSLEDYLGKKIEDQDDLVQRLKRASCPATWMSGYEEGVLATLLEIRNMIEIYREDAASQLELVRGGT